MLPSIVPANLGLDWDHSPAKGRYVQLTLPQSASLGIVSGESERLEPLTSVEICAGAGGQALGLERAGFSHLSLVEIEYWACETLKRNRPEWNVLHQDVTEFSGYPYRGVDLLAGGVPCPPFSVAGHRLGHLDDRDLFPQALRLVREIEPRAVLLENVRGLLAPEFSEYRASIQEQLKALGYDSEWRLLNASDFGVPQLRPRAILVAMRPEEFQLFKWPEPFPEVSPTVGEALYPEMASLGWPGAEAWSVRASKIAPTLVGGSKKHGGPDLGPTRARKAWRELGVDGSSLADAPPGLDFAGVPKLTVQMAAIVQGFPADWVIAGKKTPAYRQVGNAFPPPVAEAVGISIRRAMAARRFSNLMEVA